MSPAFIWTDKNMACIATYNILEGDQQLNQFERFFLSFNDAGKMQLCKLPYYPKFGGAAADIEGRAAQMARQYFKFLIIHYTNRKERSADNLEAILAVFQALFSSTSATITDLAKAADDFLKFKSESGTNI